MSDEDSDFDEMLGGGKKARAGKSAQKKRKRPRKRVEDSDSDILPSDEESSGTLESSSESDGELDEEEKRLLERVKRYDKDGYLNEEDRRNLAKLPEIEREKILADRVDDRDDAQLRLDAKRKLRRKDGRAKKASRRDAGRKDKLGDKKARRKKFNDEEVRRQDLEAERERERLEREEEDMKRRAEITVDLLRSAQITRDDLVKWDYYGHLETTLVGAFIRAYIGQNPSNNGAVYRLCRIDGVTELEPDKPPYAIDKAKPQVVTRHQLILSHGKAVRNFGFDKTSNTLVTQDEFARWEKTMEADKTEWPSRSQVDRKARAIAETRRHIPSQAEFDEMIKNKKAMQKMPRNVGAQKAQLYADLKVAQDANDEEKVASINQELAQLENVPVVKGADRLHDWSVINQRNRQRELEERKAAVEAERRKKHSTAHPGPQVANEPKSIDMMDLDVQDEKLVELPVGNFPGKSRFEIALAQYHIDL